MIKRESLQKKMAMVGMLVLLLAASSVAQTSLEISGPENCTNCSANASSSPGLESAALEMNSSNAPVSIAEPDLVSPSGILNTGKPTYVWKGVAGCKYYCLEVKNALNNIMLKQWYDASDFPPAPDECSVTPQQSLDPGDYSWRIQSWNCLDHKWSQKMDFTVCASSTFPGKATLVSPKDVIGSKNPTFVWKPVTGCTQYCLKVSNANDQNHPLLLECYDSAEVLSDQTCSITPPLNLAAGSYRWWIQTRNCKGDGPWSNYMSFNFANKSPGRSTPLSPQGLISTATPTFAWTAVSAATKYHLQVENSSVIVVNEWYDAEEVARGSRCSAFLPIALPDDDAYYYWRVRAGNDAGNGPWSALKEFEMICAFKPGPIKKEALKV